MSMTHWITDWLLLHWLTDWRTDGMTDWSTHPLTHWLTQSRTYTVSECVEPRYVSDQQQAVCCATHCNTWNILHRPSFPGWIWIYWARSQWSSAPSGRPPRSLKTWGCRATWSRCCGGTTCPAKNKSKVWGHFNSNSKVRLRTPQARTFTMSVTREVINMLSNFTSSFSRMSYEQKRR